MSVLATLRDAIAMLKVSDLDSIPIFIETLKERQRTLKSEQNETCVSDCEDSDCDLDWTDAFCEYGHSCEACKENCDYITLDIVQDIQELGYKCKIGERGSNPQLITQIVRQSDKEVVYCVEKNNYTTKRQEFYETVPEEIIECLTYR